MPETTTAPSTPSTTPQQQAAPAQEQATATATADQGVPATQEQAATGTPEQAATPAEESKLARARAAAQAARNGANRYKQTAAERDRIAAQARQTQDENRRLQETLRQRDAQFEEFKRDPYRTLKAAGMTEEQLIQRALKEGTPEQQVQAVLSELEKERDARVSLEKRINEERATVVRTQAEQVLVRTASDEGKYPHLSQQPSKIVIQAAHNLLREAAGSVNPETGMLYDVTKFTYDEVCETLELLWARDGKSKATSAQKVSEKEPAAAPAKQPQKTKTLTNRMSQTSFAVPANYDSLPETERRQLMAKWLMEDAVRRT